MIKYIIKKGKNLAQNSLPTQVFSYKKISKLEMIVSIPETSLFDYKGDKDQLDKSKIAGFHLANFPWNNAKDNLLLSFSQVDNDRFEINPYLNYNFKHRVGKGVIAYPGQKVLAVFEKIGNRSSKRWHTKLVNLETRQKSEDEFGLRTNGYWMFGKKMRSMRGPWYGGANNQDGPYGDTAPKDIIINLSFKFS